MRILRSIVLPLPALVPALDPKVSDRGADRKSSVTNRSGTKAYCFKSLRGSVTATVSASRFAG
jgi:hypothetical protein